MKRVSRSDEQLSYSRIVVLDEGLLQQIFDRNGRACGDMHGDVLRERDEFIGVGREVVAHGKLDEYADFALVAVALDVAIELMHEGCRLIRPWFCRFLTFAGIRQGCGDSMVQCRLKRI